MACALDAFKKQLSGTGGRNAANLRDDPAVMKTIPSNLETLFIDSTRETMVPSLDLPQPVSLRRSLTIQLRGGQQTLAVGLLCRTAVCLGNLP